MTDYRRSDPHHPDRCGGCGRLTKRNKDGAFIKHRPNADTFSGPYCPGPLAPVPHPNLCRCNGCYSLNASEMEAQR